MIFINSPLFSPPAGRAGLEKRGINGKSENHIEEYDLRTEIIQEKGLTVIRFTNEEIENNIEEVLKALAKKITHPCLSGRQAKSLPAC